MKRFLLSVLLLLPLTAFADTEVGSFTVGVTGCSTSPTASVSYVKDDTTGLTLLTLPNITCTSNATDFSLTGLPTNLLPLARATYAVNVMSGGKIVPGQLSLVTGVSSISFSAWNGTTISGFGFADSGAKGLPQSGVTVLYPSSIP